MYPDIIIFPEEPSISTIIPATSAVAAVEAEAGTYAVPLNLTTS
jgi:hypothetical protein